MIVGNKFRSQASVGIFDMAGLEMIGRFPQHTYTCVSMNGCVDVNYDFPSKFLIISNQDYGNQL